MVKIENEKDLNPEFITIIDYEEKDNSGYLPVLPWKICEIDLKQKYYFTDIIDLKISDFAEYNDQPIIPLNSKCLKIYTAAVINPSSLIKQVLVKNV